ncbi:MAG: DMT family transporter [Chloroflexota bacterium]
MLNGSDLAVVVFGLAAAAAWGGGDFSGGLASRRTSVTGVVIVSYTVGFLLLIFLALLRSEPLPSGADLFWGIAAGLAGVVGLTAFYRALAIGQMGILAPVTGVLSAALPVAAGIVTQGLPGTIRLIGFGLALISVWFISRSEEHEGKGSRPIGLGLAILAGIGFGAFLTLIAQVSPTAVFWPLAAARAASITFMLIVATISRQKWIPPRGLLPLLVLGGSLDSIANAFYVLATQAGRLDVAAVLSSLYPASTVLLAALILKERMSRIQITGVATALMAIVLIVAH